MMKMGKHVKTVMVLDGRIAIIFQGLKDLVALSQNKAILDATFETLSVVKSFPLAAAIAGATERRMQETGESEEEAREALAKDPVAVKAIAIEGGLDAATFKAEIGEFREEILELREEH